MRFKYFAMIIVLSLLAVAPAMAQTATYTVWGSTGAAGEVTNQTNPIYTFTASTTALTNVFSKIPARTYSKVLFYFDGDLYMNGTVATKSLGIPLPSTKSPIMFDLPAFPNLTGLNVIASAAAVSCKLLPIR